MEDKLYACSNLEEPPTSASMPENSKFSQIVFANVKRFYAPETDLTCYYNISKSFTPSMNDWVGIFKVGWKTTTEYYTFMWVPDFDNPETSYAEKQQVLFKAYYLPKDEDYYQFCYVDQDGKIHGASIPFQFLTGTKDDIPVVPKKRGGEKTQQQNETLLQENNNLKKDLASLQEENVHLQEELVEAKALQAKVNTLEDKCEKLESQNKDLEKEKSAIKEDLMQVKMGKESALSQKEQLENLLKTTLNQKEEFQVQVHIQQKEMENLQDRIKDKAMDLEDLKEENYQLNAALFRQQMMINLHEEQAFAFQILKKQKDDLEKENQKLWQENEMLKAQLPAIRSPPPGFLPQSPPNPGLLFRNPFAGIPPPEMDSDSQTRCPICQEVFPNDAEHRQYLDHVQNHILSCPYCDTTFRSSEKQVYDDHVFCHCLDQD